LAERDAFRGLPDRAMSSALSESAMLETIEQVALGPPLADLPAVVRYFAGSGEMRTRHPGKTLATHLDAALARILPVRGEGRNAR